MKNSRFFRSIYHVIMVGLLVPTTTLYGQLSMPRRAFESTKHMTASTKNRLIARLDHELNLVKAGINATKKRLQGQPLTASEAVAESMLAKHAGILVALIGIAAGIGVGTYLGLRKKAPTKAPTTEEQIIAHLKPLAKEYSEQKKEMSEQPESQITPTKYPEHPEVWPGPTAEDLQKGIEQLKKPEKQERMPTTEETLKGVLAKRRRAIAQEEQEEEDESEF